MEENGFDLNFCLQYLHIQLKNATINSRLWENHVLKHFQNKIILLCSVFSGFFFVFTPFFSLSLSSFACTTFNGRFHFFTFSLSRFSSTSALFYIFMVLVCFAGELRGDLCMLRSNGYASTVGGSSIYFLFLLFCFSKRHIFISQFSS